MLVIKEERSLDSVLIEHSWLRSEVVLPNYEEVGRQTVSMDITES